MTESIETKPKKKRSPKGGAAIPGAPKRTAYRDRPDRAEIEHALCTGESVRKIAKRFEIDENVLYNVRRKIPPAVRAAYLGLESAEDLEKLRTKESDSILRVLAGQRARLLALQDAAFAEGDAKTVSLLARNIHDNVWKVADYLGELTRHTTQTVLNYLVTPEWITLRNAIVTALQPFPEARAAVFAAIQKSEAQAAPPVPALPSPDEIVQ
jgi:hypothetical protein